MENGEGVIQAGSSSPNQPCWKEALLAESVHIDTSFPEEWQPVNQITKAAIKESTDAYSFHSTRGSNKPSASIAEALVVSQQSDVVIGPDHVQYAHPGDGLTFTHWLTNLGSYTDTFLIQLFPSISWPVSPTAIYLSNVGLGEVRPVTVTITVPHDAQIHIENEVIISATSTTGPAADSAVDAITVSPWNLFLPIVVKPPYISPDPFCNGDFSEELTPCWSPSGNLAVQRLCSQGSCFARLGRAQDDSRCWGELTPGNAILLQTFTPATTGNASLTFEYEIHTQDVLSDLYDSLEVYVDGNLKYRVVKENPNYGCGSPSMVVSGTDSIPISLVREEEITIEFRLTQNDAWYNTYSDIRNVQIIY
jgi:hypothetical protein